MKRTDKMNQGRLHCTKELGLVLQECFRKNHQNGDRACCALSLWKQFSGHHTCLQDALECHQGAVSSGGGISKGGAGNGKNPASDLWEPRLFTPDPGALLPGIYHQTIPKSSKP